MPHAPANKKAAPKGGPVRGDLLVVSACACPVSAGRSGACAAPCARPAGSAALVPADAVSTTVIGTSAGSAVGSAMRACNASGRCRSTYDGIGLIKRQRRAILCPLHGHRHRNQHQGSDHNGECLHWLSLSMRFTVGDYSPTALLRKLVLAARPRLGPRLVSREARKPVAVSAEHVAPEHVGK